MKSYEEWLGDYRPDPIDHSILIRAVCYELYRLELHHDTYRLCIFDPLNIPINLHCAEAFKKYKK